MSTTTSLGGHPPASGGDLISSDRVEGTNVYDQAGNHLGSIESLMITKVEGKVAYAVLSFGGFLGLGSEHFPVPWSELSYSHEHNGYVTTLTEADLTGAPKYGSETEANWSDEDWRGSVDRHYGTRSGGLGDDLLTGPRGYR
jgi:sporulation protein YlmC with PRC-barrel domain